MFCRKNIERGMKMFSNANLSKIASGRVWVLALFALATVLLAGAPGAEAATVEITSAPSNPDNDQSPSVEFTVTDATGDVTTECLFDNSDWAECTSPYQMTDLNDGDHYFSVRATDDTGTNGAGHDWHIDTVAPTISSVSGPDNPSNSASASFTVTCLLYTSPSPRD